MNLLYNYPAKTVGRELYNVDREPEEIVPVRILLRSYFD